MAHIDIPVRRSLAPGDVASRLGVTTRTVYRLLDQPDERDRLPAFKVGGQIRIDHDVLEQWIAAHDWFEYKHGAAA